MSIALNRPAENLDEMFLTLRPEPLQTPSDFANFYSEEMDEARGGNRIAPMVRGLNQSFGHTKYKTFFIGHPGVGKSTEIYRSLFVDHAQIFRELRTHLIFNIPVGLAYSGHQQALVCKHVSIYDAPVYRQDHRPDEKGRTALRSVLDERVKPEIFAEDQQLRLIVASGGNLTDLLFMTLTASNYAALRPDADGTIHEADVTRALNDRRRDYRNRLGSGAYDLIPYEEKAKRLAGLYDNDPGSDVPDAVLLALLRASVVQEFNGTGWFGVHPFIVDVLVEHKKLEPPVYGGHVLGGRSDPMSAPADEGVEGTVAGAIELLARWARLSPDGVALAEFDYPLAQEAVLDGLEDRLRERVVPLHRIVLEPRTPAEEQVRRLITELSSLPPGVVSVTGFLHAFPDAVPLRESLLNFNYNRETIVHLPHKQIWWMTPAFAAEFSIEARELDRFFLLRARLTENDLRAGAGSSASRHSDRSPKL